MKKSNAKTYLSRFVPFALGAFLVGIVGGFTTVLGPAFVKDLRLDYNNTTWTALALAISTAAFSPMLGRLADAAGRKNTLMLGIFVFTLGNILTATAPSLPVMLLARFVVGIGTAAITPCVVSYVVAEFPREKQARGFSLYMLISSCAVIFGPTLGGILISAYGWRKMMWVCVGISVVVFLLCIFLPGENKTAFEKLKNFDHIGSVFAFVFFGLLLCIPSFGQNFGWGSKAFFLVLVAAAVAFCGLYLSEKKAKEPVLRRDFIMRKAFFLSVGALFLTQGLMQANMTNMIVFINYTQPENTLISGYAISIMYIGMSLGAVVLGPLADKFEPKKILAFSLGLTGLGCAAMLFFSANTPPLLLSTSLGILGFGLGGNGTIFMKVVLSNLPTEAASTNTGTYGLFRDLAAPFGVAIFVPLFTNEVTESIGAGLSEVEAAVGSIRKIGAMEVLCVAAGIILVLFLPKIHEGRKTS